MYSDAATYFLANNTLHPALRSVLEGEDPKFQAAIRDALVDTMVGDGAEENEPLEPLFPRFATCAAVVRFYGLLPVVEAARDWFEHDFIYVGTCNHTGACPCDAAEVPVAEYFSGDHGLDGGDYPDQDR